MENPGMMGGARREERAFFWLVIIITLAFVAVIAPFYGAALWGVVIAILFWSLHLRVLGALRNPNLAAAATLLLILVIVILPLVVLALSIASEASEIYEKIQSGNLDLGKKFQGALDAMPGWASDWLNRFGLASFSDLKTRVAEGLSQISQAVVVKAISIGQSTFDLLLNLFVMLYLLFFLLRDGKALVRTLEGAIPLKREHKRALFERFDVVIRATVKGNVIVAILQGGLGGMIFGMLGIQGALLWGAMMALLSLLPAVGAAMIWLPVAIYLLATGLVAKGIILLVFGIVVISLVDNLVRPMLVSKDTKIPDYVILISTLGGIAVFGVNGFVIGPLIAALFISVWDIYTQTRRASPGTK